MANGNVKTVEIDVKTDQMWEGLSLSAVFFNSEKGPVYEILLTNGKCTVPHEVLEKKTTLHIGLRGTAPDQKKVSTLVTYDIKKGAPESNATAEGPTPDVYQQILKRLDEINFGGSDERIEKAVRKYLENNPVNVVVDDALLEESENPVQNKVITKEIRELSEQIVNSNDYVTPQMFGAVGDGSADDTDAILRCVSTLKEGDILVFESTKTYVVNSTIDIDKNIHILSLGKIVFSGTRNVPIMRLKNISNKWLIINSLSDVDAVAYHGYESNDYCGLELINTKHSNIKIGTIKNTTVGVRLKAIDGLNGGFVNNVIDATSLSNCKIGVEFYGDGHQSWINANIINNVWLSYTSDNKSENVKNANVDRFGIKETFVNGCEFPHDSNIINDFKIDVNALTGGTFTGIELSRAKNWTFNDYRIEITNSPNATFCNIDCEYGAVEGILFYPTSEIRTIIYNNSINILNYGVGQKQLSSVYTVHGGIDKRGSYLLMTERFGGKRKEYIQNYTFIEGWFVLPIENTNLFSDEKKENTLVYTTLKDNICPAVNNCTCYLYEPAQNTSYKVTFNGKNNHNIKIKCYDESGELITTPTLNTDKMYFNNGIYYISNPITNGMIEIVFTVVEVVKYVAITLSGAMSTLYIEGDYSCPILKSASGKYKEDVLYVASAPTLTTDFKYGDTVFDASNNGWKLDRVNSSEKWVTI